MGRGHRVRTPNGAPPGALYLLVNQREGRHDCGFYGRRDFSGPDVCVTNVCGGVANFVLGSASGALEETPEMRSIPKASDTGGFRE